MPIGFRWGNREDDFRLRAARGRWAVGKSLISYFLNFILNYVVCTFSAVGRHRQLKAYSVAPLKAPRAPTLHMQVFKLNLSYNLVFRLRRGDHFQNISQRSGSERLIKTTLFFICSLQNAFIMRAFRMITQPAILFPNQKYRQSF